MRRLEAEDSDVPDNELIEIMLRDVGLEYIAKRAICIQKYYMRQPRGLYKGLDTSVQQFVARYIIRLRLSLTLRHLKSEKKREL
jgi:hypothetical protein